LFSSNNTNRIDETSDNWKKNAQFLLTKIFEL
jgi:hypothetical protein